MNLQAQLLTNENVVWIADAVLLGQCPPVQAISQSDAVKRVAGLDRVAAAAG